MNRKRARKGLGSKRLRVEPMPLNEKKGQPITQEDIVAVAKGILALMFLAFVFYVLFS